MKQTKLFIVSSIVAVAITAMPLVSFAQSNNNGRGNQGHGNANGHSNSSISKVQHGVFSNLGSNFSHLFAANTNNNSDSDGDNDNSGGNQGWNGGNGGSTPSDPSDPSDPASTSSTTTITQAQSPVVTGITSPTVLSLNQTGTWTVNAYDPQNGSLSYSVNWGDLAPNVRILSDSVPVFSQTASFSHSYSTAGTYTVTFTVKDDSGLTAVTSVTVHVGPFGPVAPVISNVLATSTHLHSANVTWTTSDRASSLVWFGTSTPVDTSVPANISRSGQEINHNIVLNGLQPGTTYYVVVGSNNSGGDATSSQTSFTTRSLPNQNPTIVSVEGSTTLPAGQSGTWTVNASDPKNSSLSYSVNWGDAPSGLMMALFRSAPVFVQTATFSHSYANPGAYTITFTVKDAAGLTTSTTTSVTVTPSTSTTTPTAPVISGVTATASSSDSDQATVSWTTDQGSNSLIWFGTSTPVDTTTAPTLTDSNLVTDHSEILTGLTASTTYYFAVGSTDENSLTSTSSTMSFTTSASSTATTTPVAPVISSVSATSSAPDQADLSWTTDQSSNSLIWLSTSTPVDTTTVPTLTDGNLVTGHNETLTGLMSGTTYYFAVGSTDEDSLTSTSSTMSFTTPATSTATTTNTL